MHVFVFPFQESFCRIIPSGSRRLIFVPLVLFPKQISSVGVREVLIVGQWWSPLTGAEGSSANLL